MELFVRAIGMAMRTHRHIFALGDKAVVTEVKFAASLGEVARGGLGRDFEFVAKFVVRPRRRRGHVGQRCCVGDTLVLLH